MATVCACAAAPRALPALEFVARPVQPVGRNRGFALDPLKLGSRLAGRNPEGREFFLGGGDFRAAAGIVAKRFEFATRCRNARIRLHQIFADPALIGFERRKTG